MEQMNFEEKKKKESLIHKSTFQNENKTCKTIAVTLQLQYIHCTHETVNTKGNAGIKFSQSLEIKRAHSVSSNNKKYTNKAE